MHPTFDVPVGIFCETHDKARIAKAGNFEVPVGITSEHENIATENECESRLVNAPIGLNANQIEPEEETIETATEGISYYIR